MTDFREYFTFRKHKASENWIGIDTGNRKNWIHLWIGRHELVEVEGKKTKKRVFISQSVSLDREQAQALIDEINDRLF